VVDTITPYPEASIKTLSVIILAGGKSSRFGRDKTSVLLGGETLLERTARRLSALFEEIIVVRGAGCAEEASPTVPGTREVKDIHKARGPLGGIYAGLSASTSFHNLVVACDMPFLDLDLLKYMIGLTEGFDVVMPRLGENTEALHAIYSKACLRPIEALIGRGQFQVVRFLDDVRVRFVEEIEIDRFDPERLSFFNINTQADLKRAEEMVGEEGP
jgi:molybdopterin-guanine dinucleotide biosynthesis protein A